MVRVTLKRTDSKNIQDADTTENRWCQGKTKAVFLAKEQVNGGTTEAMNPNGKASLTQVEHKFNFAYFEFKDPKGVR